MWLSITPIRLCNQSPSNSSPTVSDYSFNMLYSQSELLCNGIIENALHMQCKDHRITFLFTDLWHFGRNIGIEMAQDSLRTPSHFNQLKGVLIWARISPAAHADINPSSITKTLFISD